jgi:hypothetical protein
VRIGDMASARDADGQRKEKHRATARDDVRSHGKAPPPKAGEGDSKRRSFPLGERVVEKPRRNSGMNLHFIVVFLNRII